VPLKKVFFSFIFFVSLNMSCTVFNFSDDMNLTIEELNKGLDRLSITLDVELIDTYSLFFGPHGNPDPIYYDLGGIHLSKEGYILWVNNVLLPFLSQHMYNKIAMVGNSITSGVESFDFGKKDSNSSNWEYLLKIKAINCGISGNKSEDIINRLDEIASQHADCYFLLIGINDIADKIPIWKVLENIQIITTCLSKNNAHVVLQYVMPIANK
jgi:lysophospholipase L1-like esterase